MLETESTLWLASAGTAGPHLIPISFVWDGAAITMSTALMGRTAQNLVASPRARLAIGHAYDVVMVDAKVTFIAVDNIEQDCADALARVAHDARTMPGFTYLRALPGRILVWNSFAEFDGRTVMLNGSWL